MAAHERPVLNPNLESDMDSKGWSVARADSAASLETIRSQFEGLLGAGGPAAPARSTTDAIARLEPPALNQLFKTVNYWMADKTLGVLRCFRSSILRICGPSVYYQRRAYLRANVPGKDFSATAPHSDVFYGHSPYAYTLWIPLYDVADDSGLYVFDRERSESIVERYRFDTLLDEFVEKHFPKPPGIRLKFGEAILFNCRLLHGAHPNTSATARVSFDTRVQSTRRPLFEKGYELYGVEQAL